MRMIEDEARQLLKSHGWTLIKRKRRNSGKEYLYARKWGYKERYILPLARLPQATSEDVLGRLNLASGQ